MNFSPCALASNISGIKKLKRDINSSKLFCNGVPVNNRRREAWGEGNICRVALGMTRENDARATATQSGGKMENNEVTRSFEFMAMADKNN